ncbi:MAG: hypothetical protein HS111_01355 [Kofleriaceae bacterium]|nr:hypothetical protein [Kofleriaceae bacterium]
MNETDNSCGCGIFSTDEDYQVRVAVTPPAGAGSCSEVCMNTNSCSFPTGYCFVVEEGNTLNLSQWLDGACPGSDNYRALPAHPRLQHARLRVPAVRC